MRKTPIGVGYPYRPGFEARFQTDETLFEIHRPTVFWESQHRDAVCEQLIRN